jgi:hypothetical protein
MLPLPKPAALEKRLALCRISCFLKVSHIEDRKSRSNSTQALGKEAVILVKP